VAVSEHSRRQVLRAGVGAVAGSVVLTEMGTTAHASTGEPLPWVADLGDGRYQNPVLNADWSDPDAVRVEGFTPVGAPFPATPGRWIGATVGLFATGPEGTGPHGVAEFDWFRVGPAISAPH
jgi:hypothetical protein